MHIPDGFLTNRVAISLDMVSGASILYAARMIKMGFRLTTIANDSGLMAKAARDAVAGVWAEVGNFR